MEIIKKKTTKFSDLKQGDCATLLDHDDGCIFMKVEMYYGNGDSDHAINAVNLATEELLYIFSGEDVLIPNNAKVVIE